MPANVETMMYAGEKPWHGIGTFVGDKEVTSAEAIKLAEMDWKVKKSPHYILKKDGSHVEVPGIFSLVRETDERIFGDVGSVYEPLQNEDAFKFFDNVVGQKAAMYHTAGALRNGSKIWILAKLNAVMQVTKKDEVEQYILLTNTHNGKHSIKIFCTPIRVVCSNTLSMAIDGADITSQFRMRHTRNVQEKFIDAQEKLASANVYFKKVLEASKLLAGEQFSSKDVDLFLRQLNYFRRAERIKAAVKEAKGNKAINAAPDTVDDEIRGEQDYQKMMELIEKGKGNDMAGTRGTFWAAYNGVTEFVDWHLQVREGKGKKKGETDQARRLNSAWFGLGANIKKDAFKVAMDMVATK